jgi:hypothetical protein
MTPRIAMALLAIFATSPAFAQSTTPGYTLDPSGTRVIGLHGLNDTPGCAFAEDTGVVKKRQLSGKALDGIFFEGKSGESFVNVDDQRGIKDKQTRRWVLQGLDQLLKKGARLDIGVHGCGAAGRIEKLVWARLATAGNAQPISSTPATGIITGELSYPSDEIPKEIHICAEGVESARITCTNDHIEGGGDNARTTYRLEVPAGNYWVFAILAEGAEFKPSSGLDYRAYYSEFVTCGSQASCPSHQPIMVAVKAGETVSDIGPNDWYAPN